ncbi:MAG: SHOCT domain-containing protein [Ignavibacteriaceae bacterium]|nr:SHOCT domain-containing protein [Ignavibacteriaceae bacterium]
MFHDGFMGGMGYGWIFWIAIIALIVFLIIKFTNQNKSNRDIGTSESSLDLLKKRYAKGEISKDEFDRMKIDLM